jgi:transaldolase
MPSNPLTGLRDCGQSVWLDYIQRGMLVDGELRQLIEADSVSGVTSNPTILLQAINEHDDYQQAIRALAPDCASAEALYEALVVADIGAAADQLRPVFEQTNSDDGYVSLEVSPRLAHDTAATVAEARRLWRAVDRPNAMIKVPATDAGLEAIRRLISEGVNVNTTLIFSPQRYRQVAGAYLDGLEDRLAKGEPLWEVAAVASFFVSRIDTLVDGRLDQLAAAAPEQAETARTLRGRTATAVARQAYEDFEALIASERWAALADAGARAQRLLWASTSTKDPGYSDVKYVEELIAPRTVNTLPPHTLAAYRDHGQPKLRLQGNLQAAQQAIAQLDALGIAIDEVASTLEREGVAKFANSYDALLASLDLYRVARP